MEFVASLDEELSAVDYYDGDGRFVVAGVVELLIMDVLDIDALRNWRAFCSRFDISKRDYIAAFNNKPKSIYGPRQARRDDDDPNYLDQETRYRRQAGQIARQLQNRAAMWQFIESTTNFGLVDSLLAEVGLKSTGIFQRYKNYCCWSRWEKVLFLPSCPASPSERCESKLLASNCLDEGEDTTTRASRREGCCQRFTSSIRSCLGLSERKQFINFDHDAEQTPLQRFLRDLVGILLFGNLYKSLHAAIKTRNYIEIPFRLIDGVIEWVNYTIQVTFPISLLGFYFLVFKCY
jgi:hypothetical protein